MSDDRDWRQYTRRGALGLMGLGGLAVASETLGFSTVTSDRGVALTVANDDSAALQIEGKPDGGTGTSDILQNFDSNNAAAPALDVSFTNKSGSPIDSDNLEVTVEVDSNTSNSGVEIIDQGGFSTSGDTNIGPNDGSTTFSTGLSNTATEALLIDNRIDASDDGQAVIDLSVSADFANGISLSLNRTGIAIATRVNNVSGTVQDVDDNTVTDEDTVSLDVSVEDNESSGIQGAVVGVNSISPTDAVEGLSDTSTATTGTDSYTDATFDNVTFTNDGSSEDVDIEFDADGVTDTLTVTVQPP
jgi:hypothetical protein